MSGGGSNGAWEAGVLYGFAHSEHPEDFYYDVMTGVSAGAINTAAFAGFAPEDIVYASEFVSDTWNSLTNADIWNYQPHDAPAPGESINYLRALTGFLFYDGALNDAPALAFVQSVLD